MTPDEIAILSALAAAHVLAVMTPGLNTALVIRAAARSRRSGLLTACGFVPAGMAWTTAGMLGIGALFVAFPAAETALRWGCALYLIYIGIGMIRAAGRPGLAPAPDGAAAPERPWALMRTAFLVNLGNPKSMAYYVSVFGATGAYALTPQFKALAVVGTPLIGFAWYAALALAMSTAPARRAYAALGRWIERAVGGLAVGFGVKLMLGR